jgi:hypothetical protein
MVVDGVARCIALFTEDEQTFVISRQLSLTADLVARIVCVIATSCTGIVVYPVLLFAMQIPYDDDHERFRNRSMVMIMILYVIVLGMLRGETPAYQPPIGALTGAFLCSCLWFFFRKGSEKKITEGFAYRLLRHAEQLRGNELATAIRLSIISILKSITITTVSIWMETIGWYGQRLETNRYAYQVLVALGYVGVVFSMVWAVWGLSTVLTAITQKRIETWTQMQAIAILVSTNTPRDERQRRGSHMGSMVHSSTELQLVSDSDRFEMGIIAWNLGFFPHFFYYLRMCML